VFLKKETLGSPSVVRAKRRRLYVAKFAALPKSDRFAPREQL